MHADHPPEPFVPHRLYRTNDPALLAIAAPSTMAHWRHHGIGPPYIDVGRRILYRGWQLNHCLLPPAPDDFVPPLPFEPERLYRPYHEALRAIAPASTFARWRYTGTGPKFTRFGSGIYYVGSDLNAFLEARLVKTQTRFYTNPKTRKQAS